MDVSGKRILVTGAGGFIGSHLCDELVRRGARVTAFCKYNSRGDRGMLEADCHDVVMGDICDLVSVDAALDVDYVFHCAALVGIPYSYRAAADYVRVNVDGSRLLLELSQWAVGSRLSVARVVHVSTSEVYGSAQYTPMDETHPLSAQSPYAATKIAADMMALAYHRSFGLPVTIVRPFNTYGPRQSTRAVIPTIITQALNGGPVTLGNTAAVRDMTYVSDTVAGLIDVGLHEDTKGEVVNLGTGEGHSIDYLAERIGAGMGVSVDADNPERTRPAASEVDTLVSDNGKALALGWRPEVSLDDGLERTIEWYRENLHRFRIGEYQV